MAKTFRLPKGCKTEEEAEKMQQMIQEIYPESKTMKLVYGYPEYHYLSGLWHARAIFVE